MEKFKIHSLIIAVIFFGFCLESQASTMKYQCTLLSVTPEGRQPIFSELQVLLGDSKSGVPMFSLSGVGIDGVNYEKCIGMLDGDATGAISGLIFPGPDNCDLLSGGGISSKNWGQDPALVMIKYGILESEYTCKKF